MNYQNQIFKKQMININHSVKHWSRYIFCSKIKKMHILMYYNETWLIDDVCF